MLYVLVVKSIVKCKTFFVFVILRCLTSRWDQPAQPKQSVDVRQQRISENAALPVPLSGVDSTAGSNSTVSQPLQTGEKSAPQGGVEMAAAMAAKINAMLMAKGKLLTPPPLLAKVQMNYIVLNVSYVKVIELLEAYSFPCNFTSFRPHQVCLCQPL